MIIDDCSDDGTTELLEQCGYNYVNLSINLGIGGAMHTGYQYAFEKGYDYVVQIDGDGQHNVSYVNEMLKKLFETDADMVIGARFIKNEGFQSTFLRRIGIRYLSWLIYVTTGTRISDPTSGYRLVNSTIISLFANDYPRDYPEPESAVQLLNNGKKL